MSLETKEYQAMNSNFKNLLQLHFLVIIWGFTAVIGLFVQTSSITLVMYRTLLAAIGILVVILLRNKTSKPDFFKNVWPMIGVGCIVGIHWLAFFGAGRLSNASISLAGFSTCSLWTAILSPIFYKRRVRLLEIMLGLVVVLGLYVILRFQFDQALGLGMGIFAGFCSALFAILNSFLTKTNDVSVMTFWEMLSACICVVLFIPIFSFSTGEVIPLWPSAKDWVWIAVLAWGCTVYPFTMANVLLRKISPFTVSLALNLEPIYGIILAVLFFGNTEHMNLGFYIGAGIILSAVLVYPILERKIVSKASEKQIP